MTDNESILAELRRIAAWADMQRTVSKWSLIAAAVAIPAIIVLGVLGAVMVEREQARMAETFAPLTLEEPTWCDVDSRIRRAELDEAIRIGEELILKTPHHPEGHQRLASAYLAAGNTEQARQHYAEAFRLFPSEQNEKLLIAIDKRIKDEGSQSDGPADGSQPIRSEKN